MPCLYARRIALAPISKVTLSVAVQHNRELQKQQAAIQQVSSGLKSLSKLCPAAWQKARRSSVCTLMSGCLCQTPICYMVFLCMCLSAQGSCCPGVCLSLDKRLYVQMSGCAGVCLSMRRSVCGSVCVQRPSCMHRFASVQRPVCALTGGRLR